MSVNSHSEGDQYRSQMATLVDGGWIVTWHSRDLDGSEIIYQQRYDEYGIALGVETMVATGAVTYQGQSDVTALADGGWIVTWGLKDDDAGEARIWQQRYSSQGDPVGAQTLVNTDPEANTGLGGVTVLSSGGWVVTWHSSNGVYQQSYTKEGQISVSDLVSSSVEGSYTDSQVTALSDGGWLLTWILDGWDPESDEDGVYQQRYDVNGVAVGPETHTSAQRYGVSESSASVAALPDGGWVITWTSFVDQVIDGWTEVYQQRYASDGATIGTQLELGIGSESSVAALTDGGWVVTWTEGSIVFDDTFPFYSNVLQQRYDVDGSAVGEVIVVNTYVEDSQHSPSVTALSDGGWVVSWTSQGQDGDAGGIFQKRYDSNGDAVVAPGEPPTDITLSAQSVVEDCNGALVGDLSVVDADQAAGHAISVSDSRFLVVDGELRLKSYAKLDFELESSVTLTVTATDDEGASIGRTFEIAVIDKVDVFVGKKGSDRLRGTEGQDELYGRSGDDLLRGNAGNDECWGEKGYDTFKFATKDGKDRIMDFETGKDTIDLSKWKGMRDFTDVEDQWADRRGNVEIGSGKNVVIIDGVNTGDLSENDFQF